MSTPLDELRAQNQELLTTLETLEAKQPGAGAAQRRARGDQPRRRRAATRSSPKSSKRPTAGSWRSTPSWTRRPASSRRPAKQDPVLVEHQPRAARPDQLGGRARPAADSDPGSDPLTDEQRRQVGLVSDSGVDAARAGQRAARHGQGRVRPAGAAAGAGRPAAPCGHQLRGALRSTVTSPDVELRDRGPEPVPPLITDETMLVRILRNLLSNALKFTERGAGPADRRHRTTTDVRFTVADTGIGIPADQQAKVFEEFHQVHNDAAGPRAGHRAGPALRPAARRDPRRRPRRCPARSGGHDGRAAPAPSRSAPGHARPRRARAGRRRRRGVPRPARPDGRTTSPPSVRHAGDGREALEVFDATTGRTSSSSTCSCPG